MLQLPLEISKSAKNLGLLSPPSWVRPPAFCLLSDYARTVLRRRKRLNDVRPNSNSVKLEDLSGTDVSAFTAMPTGLLNPVTNEALIVAPEVVYSPIELPRECGTH